MSRMIIIDGSYYLHRAHYAGQQERTPLTTKAGFPTAIIKIMSNMLKKVMREYSGCPILITFDHSGKNFRHELYSEYKGNRKETPEEIRKQYKPVKKMCKLLGLKVIVKAGVEADDVLGTVAKHATNAGIDLTILTGDKDIAQFVNDRVSLFDSKSGKRTTPLTLFQSLGIYPGQVVSYLALCGDTSDNIPGVDGVGPKTAVKWLQQYKNLKQLCKHSKDIKGKVGEKLRDNIDVLKLSYKLAKGKDDVELSFDTDNLEHLNTPKPNVKKLNKLFSKYEMKPFQVEYKGGWMS